MDTITAVPHQQVGGLQVKPAPVVDRRHQGDRRKESKRVIEDRRAEDWRRAADRHARAHQGPTPESTVALFFRNEAARIEDETR